MSKRALLMLHMLPDPRCDRVSRILAQRGFELDWICPAEGDALPPVDEHEVAVVYGGVQSANDQFPYIRAEIEWIGRWIETDRPYLGLCLGGQLLARSLGAKVQPHPSGLHEAGYVPVTPTTEGRAVLSEPLHIYSWHEEGFDVPRGAVLLAEGERFLHQAFRYGSAAYGLQFHPEANPELVRFWMDEAGEDAFDEPGVHSRARQLRDQGTFDGPMGAWLERFIDQHLLPCAESAQSVAERACRSAPP